MRKIKWDLPDTELPVENSWEYEKTTETKLSDTERNIIDEILTLEKCLYVMRRTSKVDGYNIDIIRYMRCFNIKQFEEKFSKEFINVNEEVDF